MSPIEVQVLHPAIVTIQACHVPRSNVKTDSPADEMLVSLMRLLTG